MPRKVADGRKPAPSKRQLGVGSRMLACSLILGAMALVACSSDDSAGPGGAGAAGVSGASGAGGGVGGTAGAAGTSGTAGQAGAASGGVGGGAGSAGAAGSSGNAGSGGSGVGGSAGTGGSASGGAAGSGTGGSAGSGGSGGGSGGGACVSESFSWQYTSTKAAPMKLVPMKLKTGVEYKTLSVEFEVKTTNWSGQCYNTYYSPPKLGSKFFHFFDVRRGSKWCNGFLTAAYRNPPASQYWSRTLHGNAVGKCSGVQAHDVIPLTKHGFTKDAWNKYKMVYDANAGKLTATVGSKVFTGNTLKSEKLIATSKYSMNLVFGYEASLECYNSQGQPSGSAECCHVPSIGDSYRKAKYTACP